MIISLLPPAIVAGGAVPTVSLGDERSPAISAPDQLDHTVLESGLEDKVADGPHGIIVHFDEAIPDGIAEASFPGFDVQYRFQNIPAVYAVGMSASIDTLATREDVAFVEDAWKPLEYHLNSATTASRAREVFDPSFEPPAVSGIDEESPAQLDENGDPIDGSGVGIAVVDSGIDARHPGLDEGKVVRNFIVTPAGPVEAGDYTDLGDGHGTRLAGIAAGTGEGSGTPLDLRGAAPGASLYGFATSPQDTTILPAIAFDWILENAEDQDPSIEIVLNGWSCGPADCGDPNQAHLALASELAEEGILVVFPVGNIPSDDDNTGHGLRTQTSTESTLPTPGVLGVASATDEETGSRAHCIADSSKRGNAFDPATWPDLAAPGTSIVSPQALTQGEEQVVTGNGPYTRADGEQEGTSYAAAHAAGVAALAEQAHDGDLSADDLEYILETTAHEPTPRAFDPHEGGDCPFPFVRADPANPWDGANFAAGHGLIDAMDAVELAESFEGQPTEDPPELEPIPANFTGLGPVASSGGEILYLEGNSGFTDEAPEGDQPHVRTLDTNSPITHTTEPFQTTETISAVFAEIWLGSTNEYGSVKCAAELFTVSVFHNDGDAEEATPLGSKTIDDQFVLSGGPWLRDVPVVFDEAATFDPGDSLSVTLSTDPDDADCLVPGPATTTRLVYSEADDTPSRIQLTEATDEVLPGTFEACQVLESRISEEVGCAWMGGQRELAPLNCQSIGEAGEDIETVYRVEWFGPPGSGIALTCGATASAACVVPGDAGDPWARCEATSIAAPLGGNGHTTCAYFTQSGEEVEGEGLCRIDK